MKLHFYENAIDTGIAMLPNEEYRTLQQAFIDEQWDNTTNLYEIQEQNGIGPLEFHKIEVWIDYARGMSTSGMANPEDFRKLIFRQIDRPTLRGLYYYFDNNYWITTSNDKYNSIVQSIIVRRCNNFLRIVDPENGSIFSMPCVIEYDMSSPSIQVSSYVITPNNHAVVIVQGNEDTTRLFTYNTRYMLAGRPFKLYAFQNTMMNDIDDEISSIFYLDLYLDELHANDNIKRGLADNGEYKYTISIDSGDLNLIQGSTGQMYATVKLNGEETTRKIIWSSNKNDVISITEDGEYVVNGNVGDTARIKVFLLGNNNVSDEIVFNIVAQERAEVQVVFEPDIEYGRQYENITFNIQALYNNQIYYNIYSEITIDSEYEKYITIIKDINTYTIQCNQITIDPIVLNIHISCEDPVFELDVQKEFEVRSMFG